MYRKIVWCYIIVLTLLDISLNTKLSAQGKSHGNGVSVHESLMEGISLQEWGKEPGGDGVEGAGRGRAAPADALALSPPALHFGHAALAQAHARSVTLTNTGNDTIHLASVAGTTPDFHASFFESKTLVPQANTTFSVVYLGRREGPVSTHLFIHTSRGLLRYPVSAEGVASPWRVWPLVGLRVPLNATLEPVLTLYNPTDTTIQVSEVYSSGAWLGLRLPGGGGAAPRALWTLAPHATRDLVRLRLRAPDRPQHAPLTAYIRIKGNMTGGGLVVGVEAAAAAPGEYLLPPALRLRTRGSLDPPDTFTLEAGNSAEAASARLEGEVWGARCAAAPPDAPPPPPAAPDLAAKHQANGARADSGVRLAVTRERLAGRAPPAPAATLTLDYGAMWAGAEPGAEGAEGAWCAGWARLGRAAAPYSLRLRAGTLALQPAEMHFVTATGEAALARRELRAHNQFRVPVHVEHVHFPPEVQLHFHTESMAPLVLEPGARGTLAALRLRAAGAGPLRAELGVRSNLSDYGVPLLLYDGRLQWEWEEGAGEAGADGALQLGVLAAGSARRVGARLHNRGPAPLCVTGVRSALAGAALAVAGLAARPCVAPGAWRAAELAVAAGEPGARAGSVAVLTAHAASAARVALRVARGRLEARAVRLPPAAPHVRAEAPLLLRNSLPLAAAVTQLAPPAHARDSLLYIMPEDEEARTLGAGAEGAVGRLVYAMEAECAPRCATGLELGGAEGAAWLARAAAPPAAALPADAAAAAARRAAFPAGRDNLTALLHTSTARAVPVPVTRTRAWPALLLAPPAAPLAPVRAPHALRLRLRNPAASPLALQALLAGAEGGCACAPPACAPHAFSLRGWRATRGAAAAWGPPGLLLLQPAAELELTLHYTPPAAAAHSACLYLRNNLTILESVPLSGRGAHPAFELAGLAPNHTAPVQLEVNECGAGGAGTVTRAVVVRNTGPVAVRLRDWRVAGEPCAARGFRLQPCAALALQPNESRTLSLHYTPDWTRARAAATLSVRAGGARAGFPLEAAAAARLVARCAAAAPRPPFEPALRALASALAVLALLGAAALAALDAERALRRHRSARAAPAARAPPLDLRALAAPVEPAPAPPPAPRRRRTPRRRAPAPDAAQERRAFERWRAGVTRRAEDSRSSSPRSAPPAPPAPPSSSEPDSSPEPRGAAFEAGREERAAHYAARRRSSGDESSAEEREEHSGQSGREEPEEHSGQSEREEHSEPSERSEHSDRSETEEGSPGAAPAADGPAPDAADEATHAPPAALLQNEPARGRSGGAGRGGGAAGEAGEPRARTRSGSARSLGRKERLARRRARGATPPPRAAEPGAGRAPPAVRWGASWSSVVSRGAAPEPAGAPPPPPPPLAPIGSDVRRRAPSHSLFYYGAEPEPWAERARPPPDPWGAEPAPASAAAAWLWGAPAPPPLRPPPGFAPRPYDPFHSLASIWTPAALDWRRREREREPRDE